MGVLIGLDAKLYYDDSATHVAFPSAALTEVDKVQDLTLNLEAEEAEIRDRSSVWLEILQGKLSATVEFGLTWDGSDTAIQAFRDAFLNRTGISVWIADGDESTTGSQGLWARFAVTQFPRDEQLAEGLGVNVTLRPMYQSDSTLKPEWGEVTATV